MGIHAEEQVMREMAENVRVALLDQPAVMSRLTDETGQHMTDYGVFGVHTKFPNGIFTFSVEPAESLNQVNRVYFNVAPPGDGRYYATVKAAHGGGFDALDLPHGEAFDCTPDMFPREVLDSLINVMDTYGYFRYPANGVRFLEARSCGEMEYTELAIFDENKVERPWDWRIASIDPFFLEIEHVPDETAPELVRPESFVMGHGPESKMVEGDVLHVVDGVDTRVKYYRTPYGIAKGSEWKMLPVRERAYELRRHESEYFRIGGGMTSKGSRILRTTEDFFATFDEGATDIWNYVQENPEMALPIFVQLASCVHGFGDGAGKMEDYATRDRAYEMANRVTSYPQVQDFLARLQSTVGRPQL